MIILVKPKEDAKIKILKEFLSLAESLSDSNDQILCELSHYLADNLLNKVCIYLAQKDSISFEYNKGNTLNFPSLYRNVQNKYPSIPPYTEIKEFHNQRNLFQHSAVSIEMSIRPQIASTYIEVVRNIMIKTNILKENESLPKKKAITKNSKDSNKNETKKLRENIDLLNQYMQNHDFDSAKKTVTSLKRKYPNSDVVRIYSIITSIYHYSMAKSESTKESRYRLVTSDLTDYMEIIQKKENYEFIDVNLAYIFKNIYYIISFFDKNFMSSNSADIMLNFISTNIKVYYSRSKIECLIKILQNVKKENQNLLDKYSNKILDYGLGIAYILTDDFNSAKITFLNVLGFNNVDVIHKYYHNLEDLTSIRYHFKPNTFSEIDFDSIIYIIIIHFIDDELLNIFTIRKVIKEIYFSQKRQYGFYILSEINKKFKLNLESIMKILKEKNFDIDIEQLSEFFNLMIKRLLY